MIFETLRSRQAVVHSGSLRIDPAIKQLSPPRLQEIKGSEAVIQDSVEISQTGRQLAEGAIVSQPAKYFGTTQINDSLNRVLEGQPEEVSRAVYGMIESNFIVDGTVSDESRRAVLLEMGLSQSRFIADHYLEGGKANEFLATMDRIAAIAMTRSADPATGEISYTTPADRPLGAPEDYVKLSEVMKQADPEKYAAFVNDIKEGGNGLDLLLDFAKKVPQNPDWLENYKKQSREIGELLNNVQVKNRFEEADTASASAFMGSMQQLLKESSAEPEFYMRNMREFYRNLGV